MAKSSKLIDNDSVPINREWLRARVVRHKSEECPNRIAAITLAGRIAGSLSEQASQEETTEYQKEIKRLSEAIRRAAWGAGSPRCETVRDIARGLGVEVESLIDHGVNAPIPPDRETIREFVHCWYVGNGGYGESEPVWSSGRVEWEEGPPPKVSWPLFEKRELEAVYRGTFTNRLRQTFDVVAERLNERLFASRFRKRNTGEAAQASYTTYDERHGLLLGTWHGVSPCMTHSVFPCFLSKTDLSGSEEAWERVRSFRVIPIAAPDKSRHV